MARNWYGSVQNRLEENRQYVPEITVGTGVTEYSWSDREAYEVIAVKDQKHVTIRRLDHKLAGAPMSNDWELIRNENNPTYALTKRGKYWYFTNTIRKEDVDFEDVNARLNLVLAGFDPGKIIEKGKQTVYRRATVSFGVASYYYDYEF